MLYFRKNSVFTFSAITLLILSSCKSAEKNHPIEEDPYATKPPPLVTPYGVPVTLKSLKTPSARPPLKFSDVESLKIDLESRTTLEAKFGKPEEVLLFPYLHPQEQWNYIEKYPRLSFTFDSATGKLLSILWDVRETDPEFDLNKVKEKYGAQSFISQKTTTQYSHWSEESQRLLDRKRSLSIHYETRNGIDQTSSISWSSASF